jgi:hypothetical protein
MARITRVHYCDDNGGAMSKFKRGDIVKMTTGGKVLQGGYVGVVLAAWDSEEGAIYDVEYVHNIYRMQRAEMTPPHSEHLIESATLFDLKREQRKLARQAAERFAQLLGKVGK